jgi:hypothetical protein
MTRYGHNMVSTEQASYRCQHVTGWIWKHSDLDPIMPKNLPGHLCWFGLGTQGGHMLEVPS